MKLNNLFVFLLLFPVNLLADTSKLSPVESQVSRYILEKKDEQLSLLEKLVNINSGTENIEGVKKVGEILRPEFEALGFKTRWEQAETPNKKAPTLIAEREGSQGKRLLLIGHLDTVFPKESDFQRFKKLENDKAKGPGAVDMKGGDLVILYALKALSASKALENTTIRVVLTGDEESPAKPTEISRKPLIDAAKKSDIALDFESSSTQHTLAVARRGYVGWTIKAESKGGHSSLIFKEAVGNGAIFELTRILNAMRLTLSQEKYLSLNPGLIFGGTQVEHDKLAGQGTAFGKRNIIAKTAFADGDLRYLTHEQKEGALKKIKEIVSQHLPGTEATLEFQESLPPLPPSDQSLMLLSQYNKISQKLGYGEVKPLSPDLRGGGDISYVGSYVSGCLIGLGAIGVGEHSPEETLEMSSLVTQTQRAAFLIYELTR